MMTTPQFPRLLFLLAMFVPGLSVFAAEYRTGKDVKIGAEETIQDDLYAFGETITIDGILEGDLIAFAKDIIINGEVRGDVIAAAQTIEATGTLGDDVRVAGQALKLGPKAKVGGDVIAAGMSLETEKGSTIAGDFVYAGLQALLAGEIDKDLLAQLSNLQVTGKIGGDVKVEVNGNGEPFPIEAMTGNQPVRIKMPEVPGGLTIDSTAEVVGKLNYTSKQDAHIDEAAKLTGGVSHEVPVVKPANPNAPPPQPEALKLFYSRLRDFLCAAVIGLVVFLVTPKSSLAWADNIRTRPLASFGGGILGFIGGIIVLIGIVIATVIISIGVGVSTLTDLVPTVVIGGVLGFGIVLFIVTLFGAFLAKAVVGLALGRILFKQDNFGARLVAFLIGLVIVILVLSIPKAGFFIGWVVFLLGLGGYSLWIAGFEPVSELVPATSSPPPRPVPPRPGIKA
jgi:cytoskeletal protein CcmA (bactofilin family)